MPAFEAGQELRPRAPTWAYTHGLNFLTSRGRSRRRGGVEIKAVSGERARNRTRGMVVRDRRRRRPSPRGLTPDNGGCPRRAWLVGAPLATA